MYDLLIGFLLGLAAFPILSIWWDIYKKSPGCTGSCRQGRLKCDCR